MAGLEYVCRPRLVWPRSLMRRRADWLPSSAFRNGGRPINPSTATDRVVAALDAFTRTGKPYRTTAVELAADWDVGRLGGFLATSRNTSRDPGAVLSFDLDGRALTLPCDRYDSVGGNLAAIAKHLEAIRGIERWGVATVEQMLAAHAALPRNVGGEGRAWWEVLEVASNASAAVVEAAYRRLVRERHPDSGGSDEAMAEINLARDEWRAGR